MVSAQPMAESFSFSPGFKRQLTMGSELVDALNLLTLGKPGN
jgi:hypothetical protein